MFHYLHNFKNKKNDNLNVCLFMKEASYLIGTLGVTVLGPPISGLDQWIEAQSLNIKKEVKRVRFEGLGSSLKEKRGKTGFRMRETITLGFLISYKMENQIMFVLVQI